MAVNSATAASTIVGRTIIACRKDRFILPPLGTQRRFPVGIGLDAVAVADVYGGGAGQPLGSALQRLDAPDGDLVHEDVEGGFVELDHIDAVGLQRPRF